MTEEKKSKNPFINLANEAKKKNSMNPGLGKAPKSQGPKPTRGSGGATMVRRSGRGG
jgi:hypothetical protein